MTRLAFPTDKPGGLNVPCSGHFGHCEVFTLVDVEDGKITNTEVVENPPHQHAGCMAVVGTLQGHNVDALVVGGIGMRPYMGLKQVGITVYRGRGETVQNLVDQFIAGTLPDAGEDVICGHSKGEGGCHGHH